MKFSIHSNLLCATFILLYFFGSIFFLEKGIFTRPLYPTGYMLLFRFYIFFREGYFLPGLYIQPDICSLFLNRNLAY